MAYNRFDDSIRIGYVTGLSETKVKAYWSIPNMVHHSHMPIDKITGHWKVINFEEESKMDELKIYTGKETIEALLEGKTLQYQNNYNQLIRYEDNQFMTKDGDSQWRQSLVSANGLLTIKMTEVVTPQVGDWVRVTHRITNALMVTGEVTEVNNKAARVDGRLFSIDSNWQILSPEEVSEYKREQAFAKVGRKLNEFRSGDIVCINVDGGVSIVVSNNNEETVRVHMLNVPGKGYTAKPHQLTPISFVEQQVDLS